MKASLLLLPIAVLLNILCAKMGFAQPYQPSNRVPIADRTLGTAVSGSNGNFTVTGGIQRGQNLFHSFQDFSVPTSGSATFVNPTGNQSIITRVTGTSFSDINGTINTQGANFLLINPNGVVFGPNTTLNVGRVFAASTANSLDFVDGSGRTVNFGTNAAGDAPLLSVNPNVLFNVSRLNLGAGTGAIRNFGNLQTNNPNQYIGLVGGNVAIDGGQIPGYSINAPGGRVELGGLSAPGSVGLSIDGNNPRLVFPKGVARSNVSLTNQAWINVAGAGGGDLTIEARNIDVLSGSRIQGGLQRESGTPKALAGDITLNATSRVTISDSNVFNSLLLTSQGRGGNINIQADSFSLQNGARLIAATFGQGNAGDIKIKATGAVTLTGSNTLLTNFANSPLAGNAGGIIVEANSLSIRSGAQLTSKTFGQGNAGNINIKAIGAISIAGLDSSLISHSEDLATGNGGSITLESGSFSLSDRAILNTATFMQGNAGNINVKTLGDMSINNAFLTSGTSGAGNGGSIQINNGSMSVTNLAGISTATFGQGNAGNITVRSAGNIVVRDSATSIVNNLPKISRSSIDTFAGASSTGRAGDIVVNANSFSLQRGAELSSFTLGQGNAGNINIKTLGEMSIANASLTSATGGQGTGGNIAISANSASVTNDAVVRTSTSGSANAGDVSVTLRGKLSMVNSLISSNIVTGSTGNGGNVNILANSLSMDRSTVGTSIFGHGNAGNIRMTIGSDIFLSGSTIASNVDTNGVGKGGNIKINSTSLALTDNSQVQTLVRGKDGSQPAGRGNAGNVEIQTTGAINILGSNSRFSGVTSDVGLGAIGNGGDIDIKAGSIAMRNNAGLTSSIYGTGDSGDIRVTARGAITFENTSGILSRVAGLGNGGNIIVNAKTVSLRGGAGLSSESSGQGNSGNVPINAGNIQVTATDSITISGESNNDNNPANFLIRRGGLFVNVIKDLGRGGDITVTAPKIFLDNNAIVNAQSDIGQGGNIIIGSNPNSPIATDFLILRRGSQISTDAGSIGQQGGNGGNLRINSNFIIGVPTENSDISANAVLGRGGNVTIDSQGIFGIQSRTQLTRFSDITASSNFSQSGTISINTPGIDPGKNATELPTTPTDASRQISQTCNPSQTSNRLQLTGRGGHPTSTEDPINSEVVWTDPRSPKPAAIATPPTTRTAQPAVGWTIDPHGTVSLIAAQSSTPQTQSICPTN
jgi:filamentous hemagglutinin family protein